MKLNADGRIWETSCRSVAGTFACRSSMKILSEITLDLSPTGIRTGHISNII